ncbi:hypothetical protein L207DRAFT_637659 [Hyaloscypha variabilis F]|uniref:C2H2-type domain-containing protein n=1 Tax=Hyaloscypha variabilis (strain UAMH 11265 / GT02V1 / F) TaxID=1149755 RepID=A0A2J6R9T3_HYAVF|nr:hypothetical protein L207DRAFT_637659 [Hyaloscypha variabilis F]
MAHTVLIDLTGNDSGDEIQEVEDGIGKSIIRAATKPNADYGSNTFPDPWSQRLQDTPLAPPALPVQTDPDDATYTEYSVRDYRGIVEPINWSKVKKFRKWDRDPNTVARDVLSSTGTGRGSPGLNHHLLPLLDNSAYVDKGSDLATIRWDLAGAVGSRLVSPSHNTTMLSGSEESHPDGQNLPARSPLKPTRGGMLSVGFGATLSSTNSGRHGLDTGFFTRTFDPTPRNGYPSGGWGIPHQKTDLGPQMQRTMMTGGLVPSIPDYKSPYASASAGAFGLDGQLISRMSGTPQQASSSLQPTKSSISVVLNPVTPASFYGQIDRSRSASTSLDESRSSSDAPSPASYSAPRRGRPPKSSNFVVEIPNLTPKKRGRSFEKGQNVPSTAPSYKKRGRPFATAESAAKAAAKAAARAAAASDSGDGLAKKKGRPFKIRTQLNIPVPEPIYIPFLCEWKGCPAELHNLETLKAHVFNVHNKKQPSGSRICLWGKCGAKYEASDEATETGTLDERNRFMTKAEWKSHINQRHLIPFAWHMGDGPKGTSLSIYPDSEPSPWLKDKDGRQVTPSVHNQPIEEGRAKENNARRFVRKIDGIFWVYERISSPEAYMKVQVHVPHTSNTSDGDDEDDNRMGYL